MDRQDQQREALNRAIYALNNLDRVDFILDMYSADGTVSGVPAEKLADCLADTVKAREDLSRESETLAPATADSDVKVDGALHLAGKGFDMLPAEPDGKKARLKNWPELATRDPETIRSWWEKWPQANPAIRTGTFNGKPGVVVDVDDLEPWRALQDGNPTLPDTRVHRTPSGGFHLFFHTPGPRPNSAGKVARGIDIRGAGGYVLAPPATVNEKPYTVLSDAPIAECPAWLLDLIDGAGNKAEPVKDAPPDIDQGTACERAREWLKDREPATEGQGGDARTFAAVAMVRDFGVEQDRAAEVLEEWNTRCEPPWDPADLEAKIDNAYRYSQNAAGAKSREALAAEFDIIQEAQAPATELDDTAPAGIVIPPLIHVSEAEIRESWHRDYIVKGWLDKGSDAQLFGEYGKGKTFVALDLAAHIAAGKPWFDNRVSPGGVLYLIYEGISGIPYRLAALKRHYSTWHWAAGFPFAIIPMNAPLVDERTADQNKLPGRLQMQEALRRFVNHYGTPPVLVVIDTYSRAIAGSASDEGLAGKFAAMAGALRRRYGAATLRIHHPGQGQKSRSRGAYAIAAGVDTEIRVADGLIEAVKERDYQNNRLGFRLKVIDLGADQDGDPVRSCVVEPGPIMNVLELDGREKAAMGIICRAANRQGKASRRAVIKSLRAAGLLAGKNDRDEAARLYEHLRAKGFISVSRSDLTVDERGAAAQFDDLTDSPRGEN